LLLAGCGQPAATPDPERERTIDPASLVAATAKTVGRLAVNHENTAHPEVLVKTSAGDIRLRLNAELAPLSVRNFLEYVESGHYDGTIFHQVIRGYVLLGGRFTPKQFEKPVRTPIRNEAHNGLKNIRGTIAMARSPEVIDSSSCQFFINLSDNPSLDHKGREAEEYGYCVFGEVIEGMDVVERIAASKVRDQQSYEPVEAIIIQTANRVR
jgi:cyclophilin family peptidyl-prolyl cis-trans isomerase